MTGAAMPDRDEFFVGYAPVPPALRRFLGGLLGGIGLAIIALALLLAADRQDPGGGDWRWYDGLVTLRGVLELQPTPMLHLVETPEGAQSGTLLLVEEGKHALAGTDPALDGQPVELGGVFIIRDGIRMVEVASYGGNLPHRYDGPDARSWARQAGAWTAVPLGHVRLAGEIADSKCYLGAMRPGDGKPHKGCAGLCLLGGTPPVLVTRATLPGGVPAIYVLIDREGRLVDESTLDDFVGSAVSVEAEAERRDDILFLRLGADGITRL